MLYRRWMGEGDPRHVPARSLRWNLLSNAFSGRGNRIPRSLAPLQGTLRFGRSWTVSPEMRAIVRAIANQMSNGQI